MAFAEGVHDGIVETDPTTTLTAPKGKDRYRDHRVKAWDAPTLRAFLDGTAHTRLGIVWRVAAATGLRRAELVALQWRDHDLDDGLLSVQCQMAEGATTYHPVTAPPKSEDSVRTIQLDAGTVAALRAHRAQIGQERMALGIGAIPDDSWVFVTKAMRHYHQNGLGAAFRTEVQRLDLPALTLHGLRHTHASTLLAAGVSPVAVAQRLGHKSVSTTLSTYAWALAEQRQAAADTTGAILSG